jgi:hypothetical protein
MATNREESAADLRTLMMLLTLVSALNGSKSTFKETKQVPNPYGDVYDKKAFRALNALATILVQDTEIVAVTALKKLPEKLHVGVVSVKTAERHDRKSNPLVENLDYGYLIPDGWTVEDIADVQNQFAGGFTAVSNPDHRDRKKYSREPGQRIHVLGSGTSCWPDMKDCPNEYDVLNLE